MRQARLLLLAMVAGLAFGQTQPIPYTTTISGLEIPTPSWVSAANSNFAITPTPSGPITTGHCVEWAGPLLLEDAGTACGTGTGTVTATGTPTQYQIPAWVTATSIQGIGPGSSGQALISNGASAYPSFSATLAGVTSVNGTSIPSSSTLATIFGAITAGHCAEWYSSTAIEDAGAACGTGGGGGAFNNLTSGTNTSAAMVVGSGATLTLTGSGVISANELNGSTLSTYFASPPAIGGTAAAAGAFTTLSASGNLTTNVTGLSQCLQVNSSGIVSGYGSSCGGAAFSALSSGTNGTAAMVVGSGASLTTSGTGTLNANELNGAAIPASAALLASNSSSQATALTLGGNLAISGSSLVTSQGINAQTGTTYTIQTTDIGKLITFSNASAVTVSLPVASTAGYTAGFSVDIEDLGAGTVTISPTTSLINGASTLAVAQNLGCTLTSDGTNYQVSACTAVAPSGGGSSAFNSLTSGTNTTAAMLVGTGSSLGPTGSGTLTANAISGTPSVTLNNLTVDGLTELFPGNGAGVSAASWTTNGIGLVIPTVTYTDTTGTGTITTEAAYGIGAPTIAATNTSVTVTNLATLLVAGPVAGTHVTATVPYAIYAGGSIGTTSGSLIGPSLQLTGSASPGTFANIWHPTSPCSGIGFGYNATEYAYGCSTGWTSLVPTYQGATAATISGCGTAGTITGVGASGSFVVGTGASTCTFLVTINGATGLTATTGWVMNLDDITAHLHCTNTTGGSTTVGAALCNSTVTTGDTIVWSAVAR